MNTLRVYDHPQVLTDDIFVQYGGQTGTSLPSMREAAYIMAEQMAENYIGTLLLQAEITGSVSVGPDWGIYPYDYISTEYGYIASISAVRALSADGTVVWTAGQNNSFFVLRDDTFGYFDLYNIYRSIGCGISKSSSPVILEYSYVAGLPSGTAYNPSILLGLTVAAQIQLNEMVFPFSNESSGDVGVTEYKSLDYSETRKPWKNTVFGQSPRAAFAAKCIERVVRPARKAMVLR